MMPHEPVLDIMRRTMHNLAFIEARTSVTGPFEVTQLINSFIGAMAHPWEQLKSELMSIPITEATKQGWPSIHDKGPAFEQPSSLGDLIRLFRNAIAHGNIVYLPDSRGHVAALRLTNKDRRGVTTWGAIVTPSDMRQLLDCFVRLVEEIDSQSGFHGNR